MVYEPLHHKYRPQTFADLVGQEAIASTLSSAIEQQRIAPAYLFSGPRGTGKTSSARIFAKSLNCEASDHPTATPCGVCDVCKSITNGSAVDVIEIDAASNTGVDNIRELIERAQFAPVKCRYKVYAIDECHMLSTAAFNSLLKTLEEPPDRVVFVLATTDPQRVLPTIISRCQRFDYRRIRLDAMVDHLAKIAQIEQIAIAPESLTLIAQMAQGGMRDAESLLDQLSLINEQILPQHVWDLVGAVPERDLLDLVQAIASDNPQRVLDSCRSMLDRGREPLTVLQGLTSFYRDFLIAKTAPDRQELTSVTNATWSELCAFAQGWDHLLILAGSQHLRSCESQIKNTTQPRLWLEVSLLGLMPSALVRPTGNLANRPMGQAGMGQAGMGHAGMSQAMSQPSQGQITSQAGIAPPVSSFAVAVPIAPMPAPINAATNAPVNTPIGGSSAIATPNPSSIPAITPNSTPNITPNTPPNHEFTAPVATNSSATVAAVATVAEPLSAPGEADWSWDDLDPDMSPDVPAMRKEMGIIDQRVVPTLPAPTAVPSTSPNFSPPHGHPYDPHGFSPPANPAVAIPPGHSSPGYSSLGHTTTSPIAPPVAPPLALPIESVPQIFDLQQVWQQVLHAIQWRATRELLNQKCRLSNFDGNVATLSVLAVSLQAVVKHKQADIEAAFARIFGRSIAIVIHVANDAPPLQPVIDPRSRSSMAASASASASASMAALPSNLPASFAPPVAPPVTTAPPLPNPIATSLPTFSGAWTDAGFDAGLGAGLGAGMVAPAGVEAVNGSQTAIGRSVATSVATSVTNSIAPPLNPGQGHDRAITSAPLSLTPTSTPTSTPAFNPVSEFATPSPIAGSSAGAFTGSPVPPVSGDLTPAIAPNIAPIPTYDHQPQHTHQNVHVSRPESPESPTATINGNLSNGNPSNGHLNGSASHDVQSDRVTASNVHSSHASVSGLNGNGSYHTSHHITRNGNASANGMTSPSPTNLPPSGDYSSDYSRTNGSNGTYVTISESGRKWDETEITNAAQRLADFFGAEVVTIDTEILGF